MSRSICVACQGDGKCADCNGTGINTHLNESEPKCKSCAGTGVCAACQGTGRGYVLPQAIEDPGLDKL